MKETLCLNDWVHCKTLNQNMRISALSENTVELINDKNMICVPYEDIELIPLDKYIFEKIGFNVQNQAYYTLKIDNNISLEYYCYGHRLTRYFDGIDEWNNHSQKREICDQTHIYYFNELQYELKSLNIKFKIDDWIIKHI